MATKPTKKKGETSTTVSVGIRIDPKIKFALDMMGRIQKRSLTAVIEWAISNAIAQQIYKDPDETFADVIDKVWSTDESTRFANMAFYMPDALTYDELRIWETIKASGGLWKKIQDGRTWAITPQYLDYGWLRHAWELILEHVEKHKNSPTIVPMSDDDLIAF